MTMQPPFERIGGAAAVAGIVERFYDLLESEPDFAALRQMHDDDLTPMRASLTGFLTGWMGGPRDWFDQHPGKCMVSLHAGLPITEQTAQQWVEAMRRALDQERVDPDVSATLAKMFESMATGMARMAA